MAKDERTALRGNPEYYRYFYSGQQDMEADAFQKTKGWNKIWASESQGMNGDTWIVYREVSDLPKHLQDYAKDQMEADARLEARKNGNWMEAVKETALDKVKGTIKDIMGNYHDKPEDIAELLVFSSRFYQYSPRNTALIYMQNPNATFVQSYAAWQEQGYQVQRGAKGMKILVPVKTTYLQTEEGTVQLRFASSELKERYRRNEIKSVQKIWFNVGTTFDIAQTDFPPEQYPKLYTPGRNDAFYDQVFSGISDYCKENGHPVVRSDLKGIGSRGYCTTDHIAVNRMLRSSEALSTLTHETGHMLLQHVENESPRVQAECEADMFGIMLQSHYGVELTDTRKSHLAAHYKAYRDSLPAGTDPEKAVTEILDNTFKRFRENIDTIDQAVKPYLQRQKAQEIDLDDPVHVLGWESDANRRQGGKLQQYADHVIGQLGKGNPVMSRPRGIEM